MKTFKIKTANRIYKNNGQHAEYLIRLMFGENTKADNRKGGADITINGKTYQIKSARATVCHGETLANIRAEYAVDGFIFADIETLTAYEMTVAEFETFAETFAEKTRESNGKNGGGAKMRLNRQMTAQREWLAVRVA